MTTTIKSPAVSLSFPGGGLGPRYMDERLIERSWRAINNRVNQVNLLRNLPQTYEAQREWFQKPNTSTDMNFFVIYDGDVVGTMGVHHIDYIHGHATTGTLIWEAEYQNRGIATMGKLVLLEYLFDTLNLRRVYSHYIGYNGRSARYSEKCGYREVSRIPGHFRHGPDFADEVTLMCERETWLPHFTAFQEKHRGEPGAYLTRRDLVNQR